MADQNYGDALRDAMERAEISRRRLSFLLAEETGAKQTSEYRALGKYLAADGEPEPPRAAILAVLLRAPELAIVPDAVTRRRGRLEELEGRVAELERLLNTALPKLDQVASRVDALSTQERPKRAPASQRG